MIEGNIIDSVYFKIDASTGQVTINGSNAIDKVDSFHLPYLMVGSHTIRCNVNCTMQIQYYERY